MSNLGSVYRIVYHDDIGYTCEKHPVVYENKTYFVLKTHGTDCVEQIRKEKCFTVDEVKQRIANGHTLHYQCVYVPCGEKFDMGEIQFISEDEYTLAVAYRTIARNEKSILGMKNTIKQLLKDIDFRQGIVNDYKVKYEALKAEYVKVHGVPYEEKIPAWIKEIQKNLEKIGQTT